VVSWIIVSAMRRVRLNGRNSPSTQAAVCDSSSLLVAGVIPGVFELFPAFWNLLKCSAVFVSVRATGRLL
jgi:hypothetical protein